MSTLLHYVKFGNKRKILLCFHGFGQDHGLWGNYEKSLSDYFTVYSFDIYYHGKSTRDANYLKHDEWNNAFRTFLEKEKIERFNLLGFSLGGRFCLATIISFHQHIDQVALLAPDGIHQSFWYRLANSYIGNRLFKYLMYTPDKFDQFIKVIKHTGIVRESLIKFAARELSTMNDKDKVFKTWTYFSTIQSAPNHWQHIVRSSESQMLIVLGKQDSIVRPQDIRARVEEASKITIKEIEGKHHHVVDNAQVLVTSFFLKSIS